jgi:hypothetical protein
VAKNKQNKTVNDPDQPMREPFDAGSPNLDVTHREAGLEQNDKSESRITTRLNYDRNEVTDEREDAQHRQAISEATGNRRDQMANGSDQVDKIDRDPIEDRSHRDSRKDR